jgi:glycosyltransferase involved in cell wall biosynthesis
MKYCHTIIIELQRNIIIMSLNAEKVSLFEKEPLVSVGIPTYNRPDGLKRTLECIIAQSYKNLEIIVSDDNHTNSNNHDLVHQFMKYDSRIKYIKTRENKGLTYNFEFVRDHATGIYFMWAADDDLWGEHYISACVDVLNRDPNVVLCATHANIIDENDKVLFEYFDYGDIHGLDKLSRLKRVILNTKRNTTLYGLMRREIASTIPFRNCFGSDHIFMAELSIYGFFTILPNISFYSRIGGSGNAVTGIIKGQHIKSRFITYFPNISFFLDFIRYMTKSPNLTMNEKLFAMIYITKRFMTEPYPERIFNDAMRFVQMFKKVI